MSMKLILVVSITCNRMVDVMDKNWTSKNVLRANITTNHDELLTQVFLLVHFRNTYTLLTHRCNKKKNTPPILVVWTMSGTATKKKCQWIFFCRITVMITRKCDSTWIPRMGLMDESESELKVFLYSRVVVPVNRYNKKKILYPRCEPSYI